MRDYLKEQIEIENKVENLKEIIKLTSDLYLKNELNTLVKYNMLKANANIKYHMHGIIEDLSYEERKVVENVKVEDIYILSDRRFNSEIFIKHRDIILESEENAAIFINSISGNISDLKDMDIINKISIAKRIEILYNANNSSKRVNISKLILTLSNSEESFKALIDEFRGYYTPSDVITTIVNCHDFIYSDGNVSTLNFAILNKLYYNGAINTELLLSSIRKLITNDVYEFYDHIIEILTIIYKSEKDYDISLTIEFIYDIIIANINDKNKLNTIIYLLEPITHSINNNGKLSVIEGFLFEPFMCLNDTKLIHLIEILVSENTMGKHREIFTILQNNNRLNKKILMKLLDIINIKIILEFIDEMVLFNIVDEDIINKMKMAYFIHKNS